MASSLSGLWRLNKVSLAGRIAAPLLLVRMALGAFMRGVVYRRRVRGQGA